MKKHFLFSTMFALTAALSYGQATTATTGTAPTPVTCTDDALHPIIGKEYTYKATGTPTGGTYHIFATNKTNFIATNGDLDTAGAYTTGNQITTTDANYNVGTNNNGEAKLSWSSAAANPSFVVVQYKAPIGACTTDNLKVYKIEPKNAFTIELRNMEKDAVNNTFTTKTTNVDVCSANIQSATYNGTKMEYNYGSQSFFYELIAANYDNKTFEAKFKLSGLDTNQSAKLKWGVDKAAINNDLGNIISGGAEVSVTVTADANVNPSAGVSIYLELVVENGSYEGITDKNITLSADATTGTGANKLKDVKADCTEEGDFADTATQTLIKRPTINANSGNFITQ